MKNFSVKPLILVLSILCMVSEVGLAIDRCPGDDVKVSLEDPQNLMERFGDAVFKTIDGAEEIVIGNKTKYQGLYLNFTGTWDCVLNNIDPQTKKLDLGRGGECLLQFLSESAMNITDGVGRFVEGTARLGMEALSIDGVNAAKSGLSFAGGNMQKAAENNNFALGALNSLVGFGSSLLGGASQIGGQILKRVTAIINVAFQLPSIPQHMVRGLGRAVLARDLAAAYQEIKIVDKDGKSEPGPLAYKLMEVIPNLVYGAVLGCMPNDIGQPGTVTVVVPYSDARLGYDPKAKPPTFGYTDPRK